MCSLHSQRLHSDKREKSANEAGADMAIALVAQRNSRNVALIKRRKIVMPNTISHVQKIVQRGAQCCRAKVEWRTQ
jgi:hypothetical protein